MPDLLLVDDDVVALRQIESILSDLGDLRVARSGADALRLTRQAVPDLLLLDLQLDDTDGLSLLAQLREDQALAQVPVVFLSAERDPAPHARALDLDALDWISKPVDPALLRARVRAALNRARAAGLAGSAAQITEGQAMARVLAVDDDPLALQAMASALPSAQFALTCASHASEALALARQCRPEAVLVDVSMPDISGFELAAQLLTLPEMADVPIIFVTQHGDQALELQALKMGAFDFVGKPFVPEILRARVGNAVRLRRRSQQALALSEAHWRRVSSQQLAAVVAQARQPIIVLDARSRLLLANAAAQALAGTHEEPLEAASPLPPWLQQALPPALLAGAMPQATGVALKGEGDAPTIFDVTAALVSEGEDRLVTLTFHDQTLRLQAEALAQEQVRHEADAQARRLMTSYLMHEIGNPLHGVAGLSQLMLSSTADPLTAKQRERLAMVADAAEFIRRLLSDALDLSRHEAGMFSVDIGVVPLQAVILGAMGCMAPVAQREQIELVPPDFGPDGDIRVLADPVRLRQCLDNLLSNACKYGRPRGRVVVRVRLTPQTCDIDVVDDGPGLSPEQVERLFVPFDRLGPQCKPGHGLGLAVTRMLAQAMGGQLQVHSVPGEGSCFTLVLPRDTSQGGTI